MSVSNVLYHYTSLETFTRIVEGKSLWFTDVSQVNDRSEMRLGIRYLIEHVKNLRYSDKDDYKLLLEIVYRLAVRYSEAQAADVEEIADKHAVELTSANNPDARRTWMSCLFCVSGSSNLLSQWRAYANDGTGVSIGMDLTKLEEHICQKVVRMDDRVFRVKVDYTKTGFKKNIDNVVGRFLNNSAKLSGAGSIDKLLSSMQAIEATVLSKKHNAFSEEKECRLVVNIEDNSLDDKIKYLCVNNEIRRVFVVPIQEALSDVIVKIKLGPRSKHSKDMKMVKSFLSRNNLGHIEPEKSKAPYRGR